MPALALLQTKKELTPAKLKDLFIKVDLSSLDTSILT